MGEVWYLLPTGDVVEFNPSPQVLLSRFLLLRVRFDPGLLSGGDAKDMSQPAKLLLAALLLGLTWVSPAVQPAAADTTSALSPYWGQTIARWEDLIAHYAGQRGLDPDLVAAIIFEESHGLPSRISVVGAVGLMQIMPRETGFSWRPTAAELLDPGVNVYWGTRTVAQVVQQAEGNLSRALAAYNGGWEQEHLRATQFFAGKVLDHYARAIAARAGFNARSMKKWSLVLDIQTSAGLKRIQTIRSDGTIDPDAEYDLAKLPASTPHAMAYSAIDAGGAAWLVEAWIIVEPIEGGTPNGRGTY